MSNQIPKAEWAIEKVRIYCPSRPDKVTLMAIAGYINYNTGVAWCSRQSIARDIGKSSRAVQRHIQSLLTGRSPDYRHPITKQLCPGQELPGGQLLIADKPDKFEHRSSRYMIPCCSLTVNELEFISGISGDQLSLGIISPDEPGSSLFVGQTLKSVVERQWESNCLTMGDKLSHYGRQIDSLTVSEHGENRDPSEISSGNGNGVLLKKKKKTTMLQNKHVEPLPPAKDLAPETENLIKGVLDTLMERSQDAPVGVGTRLREEFDRKFGPAVDRPV